MVSRSRLKSFLTGLALYTMAAAMVGYFGVNAYTGKYGLNARQELDYEIVALTSELARTCWTSARAISSIMPIRAIWSGRSIRTNPQISNNGKIDYENVACVALRHSHVFVPSRNPFMAV
jgi:hypothetical protein